jgi:hypothetical protein
MTLEQLVIEERKAYYREWRAANKDKVKKHNATYWEKRALKKLEENARGDKEVMKIVRSCGNDAE